MPMRNASGDVVGILFVGTDLSAFQAGMQQQVSNTRLFEHGGAMVIAPGARLEDAVFMAHRTPPRPQSTGSSSPSARLP